MVSYAISLADFVVIPVQGSPLDAEQAARQVRLIRGQERIAGRAIPFAVLFTRANPAIQPRAQRFIEERFAEANVPMFAAKLYEREAFRYIFAYGGTIAGLKEAREQCAGRRGERARHHRRAARASPQRQQAGRGGRLMVEALKPTNPIGPFDVSDFTPGAATKRPHAPLAMVRGSRRPTTIRAAPPPGRPGAGERRGGPSS